MVIVKSLRIIITWFIFCLHCALSHGRSENDAKLQCVAGCLTTFRDQADPNEKQRFIDQSQLMMFRECVNKTLAAKKANSRHALCETCVTTCTTANTSISNCSAFCQRSNLTLSVCEPVCKEVLVMFKSRLDSCPSPLSVQSCMNSVPCTEDTNCPDKQRCCLTERCGEICLSSSISKTKGLPPVPQAPECKSDETSEWISLDWRNYDLKSFPDPIVFHVQYRQYRQSLTDSTFEDIKMSKWMDSFYTFQQFGNITIRAFGYFYQFRLVAISKQGHLGYSDPSLPVGKIFPRVSEPSKLREYTISSTNNLVNVELRWDRPRKDHFWKITKYKLLWRKKLKNSDLDEDEETFKTAEIAWSKTNYVLAGLEANTHYEFKIAAVATFKNWNSTSRYYTLNVQTPKTHKKITPTPSFSNGIRFDLESIFSPCTCAKKESNAPVFMQSYLQGTELKVNVSWKHPSNTHRWLPVQHTLNFSTSSYWIASYVIEWGQKVCIDSESGQVKSGNRKPQRAQVQYNNRFEINALQFNCHYVLRLQALSNEDDPVVYWSTCFCTPPCKDTSGALDSNTCPAEVDHVPQPPLHLRFKMLSANMNTAALSVQITWSAPNIKYAISGFCVTWGARIKEDVPFASYSYGGLLPQLDITTAHKRVLESGFESLVLHGLSAETIYVVQVQTLTVFGDSEPSLIFFRTPNSTFKVVTTIIHEGLSNQAAHGAGSCVYCRSFLALLSLAAMICLLHLFSR